MLDLPLKNKVEFTKFKPSIDRRLIEGVEKLEGHFEVQR